MYFSNEDLMDLRVNEEINNYKHEALESLKTIVDPQFADKFLTLVAYCMQEEFPEAEHIFKHLKLEEKHAVAGLDNKDQFRALIIEEDQARAIDYATDFEYEGLYA